MTDLINVLSIKRVVASQQVLDKINKQLPDKSQLNFFAINCDQDFDPTDEDLITAALSGFEIMDNNSIQVGFNDWPKTSLEKKKFTNPFEGDNM